MRIPRRRREIERDIYKLKSNQTAIFNPLIFLAFLKSNRANTSLLLYFQNEKARE